MIDLYNSLVYISSMPKRGGFILHRTINTERVTQNSYKLVTTQEWYQRTEIEVYA